MGSFNNHVDKKRGGGVSQMSTIVHAREGGCLGNVHVDKTFGKMCFFAPKKISIFLFECDIRHALRFTVLCKFC